MGPYDDLKQALREEMKRQVPVQTLWATAEKVDETTMTVADADEPTVKYYKVLLGLDGMIIQPVEGSRVLIGIIENNDKACFLIHAEQWKSCKLNGDRHGGIGIVPNIAARLKEHESKVNALIDYLAALPVPVSSAVSGPPVPAAYVPFKLTATDENVLQNEIVKHG